GGRAGVLCVRQRGPAGGRRGEPYQLVPVGTLAPDQTVQPLEILPRFQREEVVHPKRFLGRCHEAPKVMNTGEKGEGRGSFSGAYLSLLPSPWLHRRAYASDAPPLPFRRRLRSTRSSARYSTP